MSCNNNIMNNLVIFLTNLINLFKRKSLWDVIPDMREEMYN